MSKPNYGTGVSQSHVGVTLSSVCSSSTYSLMTLLSVSQGPMVWDNGVSLGPEDRPLFTPRGGCSPTVQLQTEAHSRPSRKPPGGVHRRLWVMGWRDPGSEGPPTMLPPCRAS